MGGYLVDSKQTDSATHADLLWTVLFICSCWENICGSLVLLARRGSTFVVLSIIARRKRRRETTFERKQRLTKS